MVSDHTHHLAVETPEPDDQVLGEVFLDFEEALLVEHPANCGLDVIRLLGILRDQVLQAGLHPVRIVSRGHPGRRLPIATRQVGK